MPRNTFLQILVLVLAATVPSAVASAGDRDFDAVVTHIKNEYGAKKHSMPFGVGFLVRMAHPAGVKRVKVAILDHLAGVGDTRLDAVVRDALTPDWQPIVRVFSRKVREQTYVYLRPSGNDVEVFVVVVDDEEATVVKAMIDPESLADWLSHADWLASRD